MHKQPDFARFGAQINYMDIAHKSANMGIDNIVKLYEHAQLFVFCKRMTNQRTVRVPKSPMNRVLKVRVSLRA